MEKGDPKLAIRHAKRIMAENKGKMPADIAPGTKVYELVEELGKYLPEKVLWTNGDSLSCGKQVSHAKSWV